MKKEYTTKEKLANWFYYNKLWVLVAAVILYVAGSMIWNALGIGQVKPDYAVAYVGRLRLPEDCAAALEQGLASLGEDVNGDGVVKVTLSQYIIADSENLENATYAYAGEMAALADITEGVSTLFLLEDPEGFQNLYQILAHLDGSAPDDGDFSAMDKVYRWTECPALTALELGSYTDAYLDISETGDCQQLLSGLYLGRRYFYDESIHKNPEADEAFWAALTAGAAKGG